MLSPDPALRSWRLLKGAETGIPLTERTSAIGNLGSRSVATIATASLLLAASVSVVRATGINRELRASLAGQSAMASRTAVHDRLAGSRIPLTLLGLSAVSASESQRITKAHLLWIVDPDLCRQCLNEGFGSWNALGADRGLRRRLIIAGSGEVPAMAQRALRDTEIVSMSKEELVAAVGPLLSSTKLLVDAIGNRVMLLVSDAFSDQAYIAIKTLVDRDNNALPARQSSQTTAVAARESSAIRTDRTLLSCAFAQQNPEPD